jgi:hypothetical protein
MRMIDFLRQNLGTIVTLLVLAGIVAAIVVKFVRDKRKGKSIICNCGCEACDECPAARPDDKKSA